jgi:hypothetical protein
MRTVPDTRVQQYWDPSHLVARRLASDARKPQPVAECCTHGDILWDIAAVYRAGAIWTDRLPPAVVFNGPIVDVAPAIRDAVSVR